jgi:hypothetical protein
MRFVSLSAAGAAVFLFSPAFGRSSVPPSRGDGAAEYCVPQAGNAICLRARRQDFD